VNGEEERAGGALVEMELGLTCGARGGTWHQSSTRLTRIRMALAGRPRVGHGLSGVLTW
jgi:hypothetical protein